MEQILNAIYQASKIEGLTEFSFCLNLSDEETYLKLKNGIPLLKGATVLLYSCYNSIYTITFTYKF